MFRQKITTPEIDLTENTPPLWTTGMMYWVKQSELFFGSDRKEPTDSRPVHGVKKHGSRFIVLPSTSKQNSSFYHLSADTIQWKESNEKDSYLSFQYESLATQSVQRKAGIIPHAECINIIDWLKKRL